MWTGLLQLASAFAIVAGLLAFLAAYITRGPSARAPELIPQRAVVRHGGPYRVRLCTDETKSHCVDVDN